MRDEEGDEFILHDGQPVYMHPPARWDLEGDPAHMHLKVLRAALLRHMFGCNIAWNPLVKDWACDCPRQAHGAGELPTPPARQIGLALKKHGITAPPCDLDLAAIFRYALKQYRGVPVEFTSERIA